MTSPGDGHVSARRANYVEALTIWFSCRAQPSTPYSLSSCPIRQRRGSGSLVSPVWDWRAIAAH